MVDLPLHEGQQRGRHLHQNRQRSVPLLLLHLHLLLPSPWRPQPRIRHPAIQGYIFLYQGDDTFIQEFYEIRQTGRTATSFSVEIQIFGYTNIWIMAVAYLAVDPTFPHHLNSFDNVPLNYSAGNLVTQISFRSTSRSHQTA